MYQELNLAAKLQMKPKVFNQMIHAELYFKTAEQFIESTSGITILEIRSANREASLVNARTLFIALCVAAGVESSTVARHINRFKTTINYHLHRFLALVKQDPEFRKQYKKINTLINQNMENSIIKDGKTFISADTLGAAVKAALEEMGVYELLKKDTGNGGNPPPPPKDENLKIVESFVKDQQENKLSGKEI